MIEILQRGNKLKTFTTIACPLLIVFAAWGALRYGNGGLFVAVSLIGIAIVAIPYGLSHGKLWFVHWRQRKRDASRGRDSGVIYVSKESVSDVEEALSTLSSVLTDTAEYTPEFDSLSTGDGLTIGHTGFHNSFVQITDAKKVVLTGESTRTEPLVQLVESACGVTLHRTSSNPTLRRKPIQNGPRVLLSVFLVVLLIGGLLIGLNAAYPSDAYNSSERLVLVLMDGREDIDPTTTETETKLSKAAFHVAILEEERTEVEWLGNDSDRIMKQARDSVVISNIARALLASIDEQTLTEEQAAGASQIRTELREAEEGMADILLERIMDGTISDPERVDELQTIRTELCHPPNSSPKQASVASPKGILIQENHLGAVAYENHRH